MAVNAVFTADFTKWNQGLRDAQAALKPLEVSAKGVQQQLQRMSSSLSGVSIKKEADLAVAAVKAIGGATRLTEAEQRKVNATVTEAIKKYDALGQQAPADLRKLQKETAQVEKSTGMLGSTLLKVGGLLAATFTISAIKNAIADTVKYAGTIQDLALKTGFGVEALQELKFAAEQNGTSIDAVSNAAFNLQKQLGTGGDGVTGALKKLGLNLTQLKNLRPEEQFNLVANKLGEVRNQSDRAAIGSQLMGKGFKEVSALIAAGLDEQIAKAREYGLVLDEETIWALEELGDSWDAVKLAGTAFIAKALVPLAPAVTAALNAILPLASKIGELPALFLRAEIAIKKWAIAQAEGAAELLRWSKITNPLGAISGQIDEQIGQARIAAFFLKNEVTLLEGKLSGLGKTAERAAGKGTGGNSGIAALDKAISGLREKLAGADLAKELRELDQAWASLTPTQQSNEDVIKRTLAAYEKIRAELPRVSGALEDLRTAHLKALEPARMHDLLWGRLVRTTMPEANRMFAAGQAALDGFQRNGTLVAQRLVDISVQMKAVPAATFTRDLRTMAAEAKKFGDVLKGNLLGALQSVSGIIIDGFLNDASMEDTAAAIGTRVGSAIGASIGMAFGGPTGAAIGEAIGSLLGPLIDSIIKTRAERTAERVAYEFGVSISEGLAQGIEDEAKRQFGGNRQASKIFHLDQIISEGGGLNSQNFQQLFARFRDLFSMVETGAFTSAQAIEVLDKNFKTFADFVTQGGSLASQELLDIIKLTEQFGLKSAEVSAFVVQETNKALGGLTTFLQNASVKTQAAADGIAGALFGIFEAQTRNGVPAAEVIKQLDPLIKQLDEQLKKAGLTGGAAFDEIKALAAVASHEIAGPLISGVLGLEQALAGLHNSGVLNQDMFSGLTAAVADTYAQIKATGVDGAKALQLIAPSLQTIWELQKDFNYEVDEATQALLDEAEAAGQVGDQHRTAQEQMLLLAKRQTEALEGLARLFGVVLPNDVQKFEDALKDLPTDITIDGSIDWDVSLPEDMPHTLPYDSSPYGGSYPDKYTPGYRTGTPGLGFLNFGSGRTVRLHGDEAVVPEGRKEEAAAKWGGGDTTVAVVVVGQNATFAEVLQAMPREARRNEGQWAARLSAELSKFGVR